MSVPHRGGRVAFFTTCLVKLREGVKNNKKKIWNFPDLVGGVGFGKVHFPDFKK